MNILLATSARLPKDQLPTLHLSGLTETIPLKAARPSSIEEEIQTAMATENQWIGVCDM